MQTVDTTETQFTPSRQDQVQLGANYQGCTDCGIDCQIPHDNLNNINSCPICGYCLSAPKPWTCGVTQWGLVPPAWPFAHIKKESGSTNIYLGLFFCCAVFVPIFALLPKIAAVMLGLALIVEGIQRKRTEKIMKSGTGMAQSLDHQVIAPRANEFANKYGNIKAVFVSKSHVCDAIAILLMAGSMGTFTWWVCELGLEMGAFAKTIIAGLVVPAAILFMLYNLARMLLVRQYLLIQDRGIVLYQGRKQFDIAYADIQELLAVHLGDVIHEDEIEFRPRLPNKKPMKITRAYLPHLEAIWSRIVEESREQIELGQMRLRAINKEQTPTAK